ncbi:MAG TPA: hypothetical protein VEX65_10985 [Flavisolibacter sp.]|nr:hypothetical protein [Flavisolibacter sp.]
MSRVSLRIPAVKILLNEQHKPGAGIVAALGYCWFEQSQVNGSGL